MYIRDRKMLQCDSGHQLYKHNPSPASPSRRINWGFGCTRQFLEPSGGAFDNRAPRWQSPLGIGPADLGQLWLVAYTGSQPLGICQIESCLPTLFLLLASTLPLHILSFALKRRQAPLSYALPVCQIAIMTWVQVRSIMKDLQCFRLKKAEFTFNASHGMKSKSTKKSITFWKSASYDTQFTDWVVAVVWNVGLTLGWKAPCSELKGPECGSSGGMPGMVGG